mgnify:CR=1 FL=1
MSIEDNIRLRIEESLLWVDNWGLRNGDIGLRIADWSLNIVNGGVRIEDQCLMIGDRLFMFKFWG